MTIKNEIEDIDQAMEAQGYHSPIQPRNTRTIKLTYEGIVLSKKNRHIISSHGGIIPDAKAKANEDDMIRQFTQQLRGANWSDIYTQSDTDRIMEATQKHTRYFIKFDLYAGNEIRRDLDNQATTLFDALVKSGALADDSRKFIEGFVVYDRGIDKQRPRAEITIKRTEDA